MDPKLPSVSQDSLASIETLQGLPSIVSKEDLLFFSDDEEPPPPPRPTYNHAAAAALQRQGLGRGGVKLICETGCLVTTFAEHAECTFCIEKDSQGRYYLAHVCPVCNEKNQLFPDRWVNCKKYLDGAVNREGAATSKIFYDLLARIKNDDDHDAESKLTEALKMGAIKCKNTRKPCTGCTRNLAKADSASAAAAARPPDGDARHAPKRLRKQREGADAYVPPKPASLVQSASQSGEVETVNARFALVLNPKLSLCDAGLTVCVKVAKENEVKEPGQIRVSSAEIFAAHLGPWASKEQVIKYPLMLGWLSERASVPRSKAIKLPEFFSQSEVFALSDVDPTGVDPEEEWVALSIETDGDVWPVAWVKDSDEVTHFIPWNYPGYPDRSPPLLSDLGLLVKYVWQGSPTLVLKDERHLDQARQKRTKLIEELDLEDPIPKVVVWSVNQPQWRALATFQRLTNQQCKEPLHQVVGNSDKLLKFGRSRSVGNEAELVVRPDFARTISSDTFDWTILPSVWDPRNVNRLETLVANEIKEASVMVLVCDGYVDADLSKLWNLLSKHEPAARAFVSTKLRIVVCPWLVTGSKGAEQGSQIWSEADRLDMIGRYINTLGSSIDLLLSSHGLHLTVDRLVMRQRTLFVSKGLHYTVGNPEWNGMLHDEGVLELRSAIWECARTENLLIPRAYVAYLNVRDRCVEKLSVPGALISDRSGDSGLWLQELVVKFSALVRQKTRDGVAGHEYWIDIITQTMKEVKQQLLQTLDPGQGIIVAYEASKLGSDDNIRSWVLDLVASMGVFSESDFVEAFKELLCKEVARLAEHWQRRASQDVASLTAQFCEFIQLQLAIETWQRSPRRGL